MTWPVAARRLATTVSNWPRWLSAGLVAVAASLALSTWFATPAFAHASLLGTSPAPGQRLDRPPTEIVLSFSERVRPVHDGVRLVDSQARTVSREQAANPPGEGARVRLPVPAALRDGTYTVSWRVVSADSHPINGAFVFTVGVGRPGVSGAVAGGGQAGTDVDDTVVAAFWLVRVAGYASLAVFLGGAFFLMVCWPAGWANRRARRIVWFGWSSLLAATVVGLLLQGPYAAGASLAGLADLGLVGETLSTDYGIFVTVRVVVVALLGVGLFLLARRRSLNGPHWTVSSWSRWRSASLAALAVLAVALPATWVGTGHANAGPVVQAFADTAHLSAMSSWVGGLVMLLACLLARRGGAEPAEAAAVVPRFSRVAMASVAVLVGTGVIQAWVELGGLAALANSGYGRLLFTKLAAVGLLLWLGAMSRTVVQRRLVRPDASPGNRRWTRRTERDRERAVLGQLLRSVRLEAAIVTIVLGVTAALVATPPGTHGHATAAALPNAAGPVVRDLGLQAGGRVLIRVEPAKVGPNRMTVSVRAAGVAMDVPEVSARLRLPVANLGPFEVRFDRLGPGEFRSAEVMVPVAGSWRLEVAVRTSEFDRGEVTTDVPF